MIKTGLSAKTPGFVALYRLLKAHPDVEITSIVYPGNAARVTDIYPELAGECSDCFSDTPDYGRLDLYIGPFDPATNDCPELRLIITGAAPETGEVNREMVMGLPEYNRKALVRSARAAWLPDQITTLGALALMPLAKNLLLNSTIQGAVSVCDMAGRRGRAAGGRLVADSNLEPLTAEVLRGLQTSFSAELRVLSFVHDGDVAMAQFAMPLAMSSEAIGELYHAFYDDHRHVVLLDTPAYTVTSAMVRGTNKAVIGIVAEGGTLTVTVAVDSRFKCGAGNIVHLLNLFFGLHELTGF